MRRPAIVVFKKLCAQCHKIYGEGVEVGPDITSNGRGDFDQLLSNIFDPSPGHRRRLPGRDREHQAGAVDFRAGRWRTMRNALF